MTTRTTGRLRRMRGVSMVETVIALAAAASLAIAIGGVMTATNGVGRRSHAEMRAFELNRQGLEHLADVLRSASSVSLAGFDAGGVATAPQFNTVLGIAGGSLTLSATKTLQWQSGFACAGVPNPGDIELSASGQSARVAEHVESGGFSVTQSGTLLLIHLTTYYAMDDGEVARVSGDTSVSVRN